MRGEDWKLSEIVEDVDDNQHDEREDAVLESIVYCLFVGEDLRVGAPQERGQLAGGSGHVERTQHNTTYVFYI